MTKERPILFSASMVRAILEGRKTQTRRVIKGVIPKGTGDVNANTPLDEDALMDLDHCETFLSAIKRDCELDRHSLLCPYGQPGDRLWVRETWAHGCAEDAHEKVAVYRADLRPEDASELPSPNLARTYRFNRWRPSIHMPRWASRLSLEITKLGVERVQEISEQDAMDEGAGVSIHEYPQWDGDPDCYRKLFRERWNILNQKRGFGWGANPWVWVVEFKRIEAGR